MLNPNNLSSDTNPHTFNSTIGNEHDQNQPTDFNLGSDQLDFFNTYNSDTNFLPQGNFDIGKIAIENNKTEQNNGLSEPNYDFISNGTGNTLTNNNPPVNEDEKSNKKRKKETLKPEPRKRKNPDNPDEDGETTEKEKKKSKTPNQRRNIK